MVAWHIQKAMVRVRGVGCCLACLTVLIASNVLSAPPAPYNSWQNSSGEITAPCPTGFTCSMATTGPGFLQRWLIGPRGRRYVQMIMQDGSAADAGKGQTTVESFVDAGNNGRSGIAARHTIRETGVFEYEAEMNLGWANNGGPAVNLVQRNMSTMQPQGTSLDQTFSLEQNRNDQSDVEQYNVTGYRFRIDQTVRNAAVLNGIDAPDVNEFVMVRAGGNMVTAGSASLPAGGGMGGMAGMGGMGAAAQMNPPVDVTPNIPPNIPLEPPPELGEPNFDSTPGNTGGGGGGTVNWNAGNDIQVIWIGTRCPGCAVLGMGMGMGGTPGLFSYQAYENLSVTGAAAMTRSYQGSAPFDWNAGAFGAAPTAP